MPLSLCFPLSAQALATTYLPHTPHPSPYALVYGGQVLPRPHDAAHAELIRRRQTEACPAVPYM